MTENNPPRPSADILLAIDDLTIRVKVKSFWGRTESYEYLSVKDIPFQVSAMIHHMQKKFGESEELDV